MQERYNLKNSFLLVFTVSLCAVLSFSSCGRDEETIWDSVEIRDESTSLVLMLSSSIIPPAGDYGLPVIDSMRNNLISGVDGNKMFYLSLYPQILDPLYNPSAEEFKFKYDSNGDQSLSAFPAFVANTVNYNYELDSLKEALNKQASGTPGISIGNLVKLKGSQLEMFVKLKYNKLYVTPHAVAVYMYQKEKVAPQQTIANGEVANFTHKNVLLSFVNGIDGDVLDGIYMSGHEELLEFEFNASDQDVENMGILTVVYDVDDNGKPTGVINAYSN